MADLEWARYHPGDIVFAGAGFGWFDGDTAWVANLEQLGGKPDQVLGTGLAHPRNPDHGNCFGECCTYKFFWVVTHVDLDPWERMQDEEGVVPRPRYHLWTGAMQYGRPGYTFDQHHLTPHLAQAVPDRVKLTSHQFLGHVATSLLG